MNGCKKAHEITGKNKQVNLSRAHSQTKSFVKSDKGRSQKLYDKFLINLVCSVCTGKSLPEVLRTDHAP